MTKRASRSVEVLMSSLLTELFDLEGPRPVRCRSVVADQGREVPVGGGVDGSAHVAGPYTHVAHAASLQSSVIVQAPLETSNVK